MNIKPETTQAINRAQSQKISLSVDSNRIYGLDILRAVAILSVLLLHGTMLLPEQINRLMYPFILDGVTIFFVLSGFLIGTILIKTLEEKPATVNNLLTFWLNRWFRTLPAYFLILIILCLLSLFFDPTFKFSETIKYFFFLQNFATPQPLFFGESWSLSVEEWFYLLVPIVLFLSRFLTREPTRKIILVSSIAIILLVTCIRFYRYLCLDINTVQDWQMFIAKQVITRLDGIMFGVLGSYFYYYKKDFWTNNKTIAFILGIFLLIAVQFSFMNVPSNLMKIYMGVFYFTIYQLSILLLLPLLTKMRSGKGPIFRIITTISLASYSIYLLHFSLVKGWIIDRVAWLGLSGAPYYFVRYFFYWAFTIFLSIMVYRYFERPIMDLRKKILR